MYNNNRPVLRYIVLLVIIIAIACGISKVGQNGMGSTIEGVTDWWNGVCEWFEERTSKEEATEATVETIPETVDPTEVVEVADETVPEETVPEEQPPVASDEATLIENADKSVTICHTEYLVRAQQNEMYDEQTGCGPFNVPHEDDEVYPVFFHPCEQMETLKHNHDGEKVKMMINLNKVSVFCCDDEDADHSVGIWNLNKIFCVGFKDTRVEVCKTCKGLANGDKVIGEVMEMELSEEDWAEIQKVACYWWETDEESGELVRVFGLKPCTCDTPNPSAPTKPTKPTNPTKPTEGDPDPSETTEPTEPDPTEGEPDHNPTVPPEDDEEEQPDPTEGEPDHNPIVTPEDDDPAINPGEPEEQPLPNEDPIIDVGEPEIIPVPDEQPLPNEEPVIDVGEPEIIPVPEAQPQPDQPAHNEQVGPVDDVVEEQPSIDVGEPEALPIPEESAAIDVGEPEVVPVPEAQPEVEVPVHNDQVAPVEVEVEAQPAPEAEAPIIVIDEPVVVPVVEEQPAAPAVEPVIEIAEPVVVSVPEAQPPVEAPAHSEQAAPVVEVVEAQPAPVVEVVIDLGEPEIIDVPQA